MSVAATDLPWLAPSHAPKSCTVVDVWANTTTKTPGGVVTYDNVRPHQAVLLVIKECEP